MRHVPSAQMTVYSLTHNTHTHTRIRAHGHTPGDIHTDMHIQTHTGMRNVSEQATVYSLRKKCVSVCAHACTLERSGRGGQGGMG